LRCLYTHTHIIGQIERVRDVTLFLSRHTRTPTLLLRSVPAPLPICCCVSAAFTTTCVLCARSLNIRHFGRGVDRPALQLLSWWQATPHARCASASGISYVISSIYQESRRRPLVSRGHAERVSGTACLPVCTAGRRWCMPKITLASCGICALAVFSNHQRRLALRDECR